MAPRARHLVFFGALAIGTACEQEPPALAALGGESDPPPSERIVLITLDTLRNDSLLGGEGRASSMPRTRAWAQDGLVFERYYSASSATQPAHATLFTGLHPWQHGVSHNGAILGEGHVVLAERLQAAGYRTAAAIASYPVHSTFGYSQGFDVFHERFNRGEDWDVWTGRDVTAAGGFFASGDLVVEEALHLLDGLGGDKQFLWLHLFDAHWPYGDRAEDPSAGADPPVVHQLAKEPERREEIFERARTQYDLDVAALDADLARIFERLAQDATETHVIVVSDHGESFGEGDAQGHGKRLTPEQIIVPLIIYSPRVEPGLRSDAVGSIDVTATLLSLAGLPHRPTGSLDLTLPAPSSPRAVLGMRSTFKRGVEVRADGSQHPLSPDDNRYFLVDSGVLYTGNEQLLLIDDQGSPLPPSPRLEHFAELFGLFEGELRAGSVSTTSDRSSLQILEALGYTGNE